MNSTFELPGSSRPEPEGARAIRDASRDSEVSVTVHLQGAEHEVSSPAMIDLFGRFASTNHLSMRLDFTRRCVLMGGTLERMSKAFVTSLRIYSDGVHSFRARSGPLHIPAELAPWAFAVLGLDERPMVMQLSLSQLAEPADGDGMWPKQVAALYGVNGGLDAAGECVGIIALGGGYLPDDLSRAAQGTTHKVPLVVECPVNGTTNQFGGGLPADEEIALDIQVVAALVPSARIAVYFSANNINSLVSAIRQAIADEVNRPRVLSISWGSAEKFWAESDRNVVQSAFADAKKKGITIVAAAGDSLATAGLLDGKAHVLFPASSPLALACGGTQITLGKSGAIAGEAVWHVGATGTGGGISDIFEIPDYQQNAAIPGSNNDGKVRRGVPDISAAAAQSPGYRIVLNGEARVLPGTSGVAPLWAALIAMANAKRGVPLGLVHPHLYANRTMCRQVIEGNNQMDGVGYVAGPGWNACTGLGVPNSSTVDQLASIPTS